MNLQELNDNRLRHCIIELEILQAYDRVLTKGKCRKPVLDPNATEEKNKAGDKKKASDKNKPAEKNYPAEKSKSAGTENVINKIYLLCNKTSLLITHPY